MLSVTIVDRSGRMRLAGRRVDVHVTDGAVTDADVWLYDRRSRVAVQCERPLVRAVDEVDGECLQEHEDDRAEERSDRMPHAAQDRDDQDVDQP